MNITRGPFSAKVDPIYIAGRRQTGYHVIISRYGMPMFEQLERDFEEAMRVAKIYIEWEFDNHTDS